MLQRGSGTDRCARERLRPWRPVARRGRDGQALRGQRHRDRAHVGRRRRRRANAARAVPAPVRTRRDRGTPLGHHEFVQQAGRRARCAEPAAPHRHLARRVGLRRVRRVRLVRRPRRCVGSERRAQPRDAGSGPHLRRQARRRRRARRGRHRPGRPSRARPAGAREPHPCRRTPNRRRRTVGRRPDRADAHATGGDRRHGAAAQRADCPDRRNGTCPTDGCIDASTHCGDRSECRHRPVHGRRLGEPHPVRAPHTAGSDHRSDRPRHLRRR